MTYKLLYMIINYTIYNICVTCQVFLHEVDWHIDVAIHISHIHLCILILKKMEGNLMVTQGIP